MKDFFYDKELYEKLKTVTVPTVFALDMGLGKTQTLYKYLQDFPNKKVLVVVNSTDQLDEMKEALDDNIEIWHSKLDDCKFDQYKDKTRLGITKVTFFQQLIHQEY